MSKRQTRSVVTASESHAVGTVVAPTKTVKAPSKAALTRAKNKAEREQKAIEDAEAIRGMLNHNLPGTTAHTSALASGPRSAMTQALENKG